MKSVGEAPAGGHLKGSHGPVFNGFTERRVPTAGAEIHLRHGGSGPPLLLLHGNPQTHVM